MKNTQVPVRQPAVDLHAVMMQLGRRAVLVEARDQPLRAGHGEVAGDRSVMGDDIHVRLESYVSGHRLADAR